MYAEQHEEGETRKRGERYRQKRVRALKILDLMRSWEMDVDQRRKSHASKRRASDRRECW